MGFADEVIGFAKGCYEKIGKEKVSNLYRSIGEEAKKLIEKDKNDEEKNPEGKDPDNTER